MHNARQTQGYSGSDMRNLIQEACQGPVREAVVAAGGDRVAQLRGEDLRRVRLRDFQVAAKVRALGRLFPCVLGWLAAAAFRVGVGVFGVGGSAAKSRLAFVFAASASCRPQPA